MKDVVRIAVTGGAGQIAYSLLFRIAAGELLGPDQPIELCILEVPEAMNALDGVKMELQDCAFTLLRTIRIGSDPDVVFAGVQYAFLVGAKPRAPGMERKDLLSENAKIFVTQAKALNDVADPSVHVLVVGNPCNTNCLIAIHNAPNLNPRHFQAMTRLDQNRAMGFIAEKLGCPVSQVTRMAIWGNHSTTLVADYEHAMVRGKPLLSTGLDRQWLEEEFVRRVQLRGAEVLAQRGKSSAASAASSAIEAMRALIQPSAPNDWFSAGVYSQNNPYGIDPDLVFSFPCTSSGRGDWAIVSDLAFNDILEQKIRATELELQQERDQIREFLNF